MKALVARAYGSPDQALRPEDVATPVAGDDGVVIRVHAASVNPADWHLLRGEPYIARLQLGLRKPKQPVLGCDVAGRVSAVGANVTTFRPGDEVVGCPFMHGFGAFAEYVRVPEQLVVPKPPGVPFVDAAAVPLAAMTALQGLRDRGRIKAGQRVLIVGASGGVGCFAVQIAKSFDVEVTAVCSARNVEFVRSLGADHVVDYTKDDVTRSGQRYDLILQVAGTTSPSDCRRALTGSGVLVQISGDATGRWIGPIGRMIRAQVLSRFVSQTMVSFTVKPNTADLREVIALVDAGGVKPVIERTYSLTEVPEAIADLERGHTRGKLVITV